MKIKLPDEIKEYEPELRFFFDCMIAKLYTNRHKQFASGDLRHYLRGINEERYEMAEAYRSENQFAFYMETVDVANMAWLAGLKAMRMTKVEWENKDEQ